MTIYFLQPFPETRPLSNKEAHVFKEEGGEILIINGVYQNREDALYWFGKRPDVTLSFEGRGVVPDYLFYRHTVRECTGMSEIRYSRLRQEINAAESAALYGGGTTVLDWSERLVCSRCGGRHVDMVVSGTERRSGTTF